MPNGTKIKGCYGHRCFATYAGGEGVAFLHNHCEGAGDVIAFNGNRPNMQDHKHLLHVNVIDKYILGRFLVIVVQSAVACE